MPRPPKTHRVIANRCAGVCAIMRQRHIPWDSTALLPPGPVDLDRTRDDGLVGYLPRSSQINPRSVYRGPKQKNARGRSLVVPESAEPPPARGFRGSGQDVPARASGRGIATNLPFAWVESAVTAGKSVTPPAQCQPADPGAGQGGDSASW